MGRIKFIFITTISIVVYSCAQVGVPSGGVEDKEAPRALQISPELGGIGYALKKGDMISVEFDEYVNVRQLSAQLLVSPPLTKSMEWVVKGKWVYFILQEDLDEDRTYIFQFGDAIVDVNEGNPASGFVHAFATGDQLDTLSLSGRVEDVFTDEKQKGKRVFVYDAGTPLDTIVVGALPLFVTTTDDAGEFTVDYMPKGEYRVIAVDDVDRNYIWTAGEALAINSEMVEVVGNDTLQESMQMQMTLNTDVKYFADTYKDPLGLLKMELSGEVDADKEIEAEGLEVYSEGEILWVWAMPEELEKSTVIWKSADTLKLSEESVEELINLDVVGAPEGKQVSGSTASLTFNRPVTEVHKEQFKLTRSDSIDVEIKSVFISEVSPFQIEVEASFGRGHVVELTMFPGAVKGFGDVALLDTISKKWSTFKQDELAELKVEMDAEGWLELISANGKVIEVVDLEPGMEPVLFKNLTPGSYALRWLGDPNGNGRWDDVSLERWELPEPARVMQDPIKVKADWSHEVSWQVR